MQYKDPNGDFKWLTLQVKCPACGFDVSVMGLDNNIKIRYCDFCEHSIHL